MKSRVDALQYVSMRFAARKAILAQKAESISTSLMASNIVYKARHRQNRGRNRSRENVIQAALEAETTEHLGYEKGDRTAVAAARVGNHRNGTGKTPAQTGAGPVELDIPRDRAEEDAQGAGCPPAPKTRPSYAPGPETGDSIETNYDKPPRPLGERLTPESRAALALAFGIKPKDLAREYEISIRSVKRLIQQARTAGVI